MSVIKRSLCNAQVSIIIACKNMHDYIIDKRVLTALSNITQNVL